MRVAYHPFVQPDVTKILPIAFTPHCTSIMFDRLKSLFAKPPPPEFRDSELGVLTLDYGVWNGTVQRGGRDLSIIVAGTDAAPDAGLLDRVRSLLTRFPDTERSDGVSSRPRV